jgi:hypothetical protein
MIVVHYLPFAEMHFTGFIKLTHVCWTTSQSIREKFGRKTIAK